MTDDRTDGESTELAPTEPSGFRVDGGSDRVGPYRLLQKLGEGGMGEVWLAEQSEPVNRRVALKVIKQGMDTKQVVARFEAERQALAMMAHPAVAKVFDAGATPQGRPYFAMEYVQGVPITEFCDRHKLNNRERLELFMQVCEGVQHAHQKAIIHRDLKPSNVLVMTQDGKRIPKIIDFGVAKATAQKLTEKTLYTQLGVLIGTPEYMSPEQAEMTGEDVDTRTDVYSLGVMLYELLVGVLPFDSRELRSAGLEGIRKKIREEEPQTPSRRVITLGDRSTESANRRSVDRSTLQRELRGDLDWIAMKSLEKDRTRRYGSPSELAADIVRYLHHEPVLARPPSTAYRVGKFVRRHRVGVGVSVAAAALLLVFAATVSVQATRIAAERDQANRERETAEQVAETLADTLRSLDAHTLGEHLWQYLRGRVSERQRERSAQGVGGDSALALFEQALEDVNATDAALDLVDTQILQRTAGMINEKLRDKPRVVGRLEHTLGTIYLELWMREEAEEHTRRAVDLRTQALGIDHPDTLKSRWLLAWLDHMDHPVGAEREFKEILRIQRFRLGEEHPDTLKTMFGLGAAYYQQQRWADAVAVDRETLEIQRRVLGEEHPDTLMTMWGLGLAYSQAGRHDEAIELQARTLEIRRRVLGVEHVDTLLSMSNLGHAYVAAGRVADAEIQYRKVLDARRRVLGETHRFTLGSYESLARTRELQGDYVEAEDLYDKALNGYRRAFGDSAPDALRVVDALAQLDAHRKDRSQARD